MLWSIVPFDPVCDSVRFFRLEALVKRRRSVRVEIVRNKHDSLCLWVVFIYQSAKHFGKINRCPPGCSLDATFAYQSLDPQKQIPSSVTLILIVFEFAAWQTRL